MKLKYAAIQIANIDAVTAEDVRLNLEHSQKLIEALPKDVELVVLPELSSCGYSAETFLVADILAEHRDGPTIRFYSTLSKECGVYICFGFIERKEAGLYISQAVVGPDGELIGVYNKVHCSESGASIEGQFSPGEHSFTFSINGIKLGLLICYDFRFLEYVGGVVRAHDLDVLVHPVAMSPDFTAKSWHKFVEVEAIANQVYMISVNRVWGDQEYGRSIIAPPLDDIEEVVILGNKEAVHVATIDMDDLHRARETYKLKADCKKDYNPVIFD